MPEQKADKSTEKQTIINLIKKEKPRTIDQLVKLVKEQCVLNENEIIELIIQLENEGKIRLRKTEKDVSKISEYLFSSKASWFWSTIALAVATTITSFVISEDAYPLIYIRQTLGVISVLFLPGYTFIKALFPTQLPIKTASESLDSVERIALSIGLSLALVPLVGLLINYTPWGITLTPLVLSLLCLTVTFASIALLREYNAKASKCTLYA
jgi:uncharacterized membrane protein